MWVQPMLTPSRTVRAIIMTCMATLCYTLNDTITKFLIDDYPVTVIIFVRSIVAMPLLAAMALAVGRERIRWSRRFPFHALRGAINLLATYLYIRGLGHLSVAEATVIIFALPFIITVLSALFLREHVGWGKWTSVIVSFGGVAIAIQPGAQTFQPASLFILAASFLYAINSVTSRWIPEEDNLWTVSFLGAAFSALFVAPLAGANWVAVNVEDLLLFTGAAFCSSLAIGLGSLAYRSALASDLAPFSYSGLIWSLGVTWIVWGTVPGAATFLGAAIIASSAFLHVVSARRSAARATSN